VTSVFLDVTPYSPLKVNWCLRGTRCLHSASCLLSLQRLARPMRRWRWRRHVLLKCRLTFSRLHSVIYEKIAILHNDDVRASNATKFILLKCLCWTLESWDVCTWTVGSWTALNTVATVTASKMFGISSFIIYMSFNVVLCSCVILPAVTSISNHLFSRVVGGVAPFLIFLLRGVYCA
jgi:hypothetical protein